MGHSFAFSHSTDPHHSLAYGLLWNPDSPRQLEVDRITFKENTHQGHFLNNTVLYHTPSAGVSPTYEQTWAKIQGRQAPYDGLVKSDGSFIFTYGILPTRTSSAWVSKCVVGSMTASGQQKSFLSRCQAGWRSSPLLHPRRVPAVIQKKD